MTSLIVQLAIDTVLIAVIYYGWVNTISRCLWKLIIPALLCFAFILYGSTIASYLDEVETKKRTEELKEKCDGIFIIDKKDIARCFKRDSGLWSENL